MPMDKNLETKKFHFKFILIFICIFFVLTFTFISWEQLNKLPSICIFKNIFGIECLGCGTIRALWLIIHFKFIEAFKINWLIYAYINIFILLVIKQIKRR